MEQAVGSWSFSAHQFDADALLYAALVMLEHALSIPELEKWKMSTGEHTDTCHFLLGADLKRSA